jgi:hypothetical protein
MFGISLREIEKSYGWHEEIDARFPECSQIMRRLVILHQRRSGVLSRFSVTWFRLFGAVELVLGVTFPLLFLYPQTQNDTALLATISVLIAVAAGLSSFYGWRDNWGLYRAQHILLASVVADWELDLLQIITTDAPDAGPQALARTRQTITALFQALNQEHQAQFANVESPESIIERIADRTQDDLLPAAEPASADLARSPKPSSSGR